MSILKEVLDFQDRFTLRRQIALRDKLGGEDVIDAILSDQYELNLIKKIRALFDHTSRCIPSHLNIASNVRDENRKFHVEFPEISCMEIRKRLADSFPKGTEFAEVSRFEDETGALKKKYAEHELVGNFLKRARRIILPKHNTRKNYRASMRDFILPAVKRAYENKFNNPKREFKDYRDKEFDGKIYIISGTGHKELISLMAKKSVSAWYSPNPFQGFSINAQREAMKTLTQYGFALAGGLDTGTAVVAYTREMARNFNTPVYTCSALSWGSADYSLIFCARRYVLRFDSTIDVSDADGMQSGGLVLFR